jgi:hypothetical protein
MRILSRFLLAGLVIFFLFLLSDSDQQSIDYEKIADNITNKTAKKLEEEKGLILVGIGGQMMNDIQKMSISFYLYHEVDLATARELVVNSVNEYLKEINNNKEIQPYLHEYPFTAKNIEISIFIYNSDRSDLPLNKIYCVSADEGKVSYFIRSLGFYKPFSEESFEEAEDKVNSSP